MMTDEVSYTPEEVAKILKVTRYTIYEMIKRGDLAAYRIGRSMRIDAAAVETYKKEFRGKKLTGPFAKFQSEGAMESSNGIILCGQEGVLDNLTRHLERQVPNVRFLRHYVGSMEGLLALYNGSADLTTVHLWDGDSNGYNVPYVRRFLPGLRAIIVNLVYRMEGFYVASGNPKTIKEWSDLIKPNVQFVNRERGSGARVLLDEKLRQLDISPLQIAGYENEEMSNLAAASKVARGEADVGLGTEQAAMQVKNVDFVPLQKEQYDLVLLKQNLAKSHYNEIISILRSKTFQNEVASVDGYDISRMGDIIAEI
jgi:putative molybdopterin biosynthesis protein